MSRETEQLLLNTGGNAGVARSNKTVKTIFCNKIWIPFFLFTFGCFAVFCAYNGSQNIATSLGILKDNDLNGSIALGILYSCFTLTCFVAPVVVNVIGAKACVMIQFFFLLSYVLSYLYPRWYTLYISAGLVGIGAGPMWVSQGLYMSALSIRYGKLIVKHGNLHNLQEDYSGLFQGYFFAIFQLTQVFGNLISGYIEHVATDNLLFMVYAGMILFGAVLLCFVPQLKNIDENGSSVVKTVINNIEQITAQHQMEDQMNHGDNLIGTGGTFDVEKISTKAKTENEGGDDLWTTIEVLRNNRVFYILPAFFAAGMEQCIMFGDVTAYISRTIGHNNIGYVLAIFGVGDAISSGLVGNLSDKYGKKIFLILACIINMICCAYFFMFRGGNISFVVISCISFVWGVADGIWNSVGSAVCADTFDDAKQRRGLFSAFRLLQSVAMIFYFISPTTTTFIPKVLSLAGVMIVTLLGVIKFKVKQ
jgi:MFS family permease